MGIIKDKLTKKKEINIPVENFTQEEWQKLLNNAKQEERTLEELQRKEEDEVREARAESEKKFRTKEEEIRSRYEEEKKKSREYIAKLEKIKKKHFKESF